jgi:hypothetical protein
MNYSQHLSSALVAFGSGDEAGAFAELDLALAEAGRVDADGPRVAEVLQYVAQLKAQLGHAEEARAAQARADAIWRRFSAAGTAPESPLD